MVYDPVAFHVEPGKFSAPSGHSLMSTLRHELGYYWHLYVGVTTHADLSNQYAVSSDDSGV